MKTKKSESPWRRLGKSATTVQLRRAAARSRYKRDAARLKLNLPPKP